MSGYGFFRMLQGLLWLGAFPVVGIAFCTANICKEFSLETKFRHQYGAGWQVVYEHSVGPLSAARTKMTVCAVGIVVVSSLSVWVARVLRSGGLSRPRYGRRRRRDEHPYGSNLEQTARYRRNALVGTYFGVAGILMGAFLMYFRIGLFAHHTDEFVLGMFMVMAGYFGVVTGCWYWLKGKGWPEAIVFIAFMPLTIFFLPFARQVALTQPLLLLGWMVMMSLVLVVVVFALPDRSGFSRHARHRASREAWKRFQSRDGSEKPVGPRR